MSIKSYRDTHCFAYKICAYSCHGCVIRHALRAVSSHACPCHHLFTCFPVEGHICSRKIMSLFNVIFLRLSFSQMQTQMRENKTKTSWQLVGNAFDGLLIFKRYCTIPAEHALSTRSPLILRKKVKLLLPFDTMAHSMSLMWLKVNIWVWPL